MIAAMTLSITLDWFGTLFISRVKPNNIRRFVSAGILLFVFFLPLHFHSPTVAPQLAKECSCFHGNKTQTGLAPVLVTGVPVIDVQPVQVGQKDWPGTFRMFDRHIRAPPSQASL